MPAPVVVPVATSVPVAAVPQYTRTPAFAAKFVPVSVTVAPTPAASKRSRTSSSERTGLPSTATMRSPRTTRRERVSCAPASPAFAAGPSGCTSASATPSVTPTALLKRSGMKEAPMPAWMARPRAMSCGTSRVTVSTGTAKPMPADAPLGLKIAVLTPMSRPPESSSGPPEFPGLMAASVWMTSRMRRPLGERSSRPSALTTPVVREWSRPNGLPTA